MTKTPSCSLVVHVKLHMTHSHQKTSTHSLKQTCLSCKQCKIYHKLNSEVINITIIYREDKSKVTQHFDAAIQLMVVEALTILWCMVKNTQTWFYTGPMMHGDKQTQTPGLYTGPVVYDKHKHHDATLALWCMETNRHKHQDSTLAHWCMTNTNTMILHWPYDVWRQT